MVDVSQTQAKAAANSRRKHRWSSDVDVHVAMQIRLRRTELGFTQSHLAQLMGVAAQQIQKYETGANRLTAGRLHALAQCLNCTMEYFFGDPPGLEQSNGPAAVDSALCNPESIELLKAFSGIRQKRLRQSILRLVLDLRDTSDQVP